MYSWRQLKQSAAATNLTLTIVLVLSFYFYFVCSCSAHLPGAWQSITTGHGGPSWDSIPDQVLWPPPSLRDPASLQGCDWTGVSLSSRASSHFMVANHLSDETLSLAPIRPKPLRGHGASSCMLHPGITYLNECVFSWKFSSRFIVLSPIGD